MRKISVLLIVVLLLQFIPMTVSAEEDYTPQAETLRQLGLFLGTDNGFELDRAATRAEAAVMTVRLLGKENEARSGNFSHPFTDVPAWASPYVGYLFSNGITTGVSESLYGAGQTATSVQYATFVLRALGYSDAGGDFTWDKSLEKMVSLGTITGGQAAEFSSGALRGYIVAISHLNLFANLKDSRVTLIEKLYVLDMAITLDQLKAASAIDARLSMYSNTLGIPKPYPAGGPLDSERVFAKASDAVFKMEIYAFSDLEAGTGSGFFITSDGIAVTNLHVISAMSSANAKTTDGLSHPVEGVLAIYPQADLAVIKVRGTGFPYLEIGDPASLRTAQRIYCIGSPLGFDNSISDGLVSNPRREYEGYTYIQISAPIAPGSSGGALLNEYGQVVGVTTLGSTQGAVNLAVPITDLAGVFRFPEVRSIKYLQAHSHFGCIPVTDITYNRVESDAGRPTQTMANDTIMYGTIKSAEDVHYYSLDVKNVAEMLISLTSNVNNSVGLKFEVSDPSGRVILNSRHYSGDIFSLATGHGAVRGLYTVKIFVENRGEDWTNVDYELFWMYHITYEDSGKNYVFLEFEPNDTPEYANYLPDLYLYISTISTRNDVDYYTFTIASRSLYIAEISTGHRRSVLNAEVFDSNNRSVGRFNFQKNSDGYDVELFRMHLDAGTYYIRVSVKDTSIRWDNELYYIAGWYMP